jgi:hypothetical protein
MTRVDVLESDRVMGWIAYGLDPLTTVGPVPSTAVGSLADMTGRFGRR